MLASDTTRIDFAIGEDADLILVADAARQNELKTAKDGIAAALRNEAFVIPLPQDGGASIRLVVGDLSDDESYNWVAKAIRPLKLTTNQLAIDAGDFFGHDVEISKDPSGNFQLVEVQPGDYLITCLVFFTSDIATDLFKRHKFSYLELFWQSHPDRKVPTWLIDEAECRDNERDEELLESIDDGKVDHETGDQFVDIVLQLQPNSNAESYTSLSKTGKLKWEKRTPQSFPAPIVSAGADAAGSKKQVARRFAGAIRTEDFEALQPYCTDLLQNEIAAFTSDLHRQILDRMVFPTRKQLGEFPAEASDWIAKSDRPRCKVDVQSLQEHPFAGSLLIEFIDESVRDKRFSVSIQMAFVRSDAGIRVAAIQVDWKVPIERKRRRARIQTGPPCPECGKALATEKAAQCIYCGATWQ